MALALGLRVWGIEFGLPNVHCRPDESTLVNKAMAVGAGYPNPGFFNYPSFQFYLLALVYGVVYLLGRASGVFGGMADLQRLFLVDPHAFYLVARTVTALLGTAGVGLAYLVGRRLGGRSAGLLGAFFLSVAFLHVRDSHFATVDVPATTYALAGCALALRYLQRPSRTNLVGAAASFGVASSTKYNLVVVATCLFTALWLQHGRGAGRASLVAVCTMAVAFLVTTPFAVLDFDTFRRDLAFEQAHFASGHAGTPPGVGLGWLYHIRFSLVHGLGFPLLATGVSAIAWMAWRRRPAELVLVAGVLSYFAVAGSGRTVFVRYALPLVPLLCVAAAVLVSRLRPWGLLLGSLLAVPSLVSAVQCDRLLSRTDTRVLAASWLEQRVPDGAWIAIHGSDFGYPQVRRARSWLEQEWEDLQAAGLAARRLQAMLHLDGYPPPPSYRIVEMRPDGAFRRRAVRSDSDLNGLRREGVEWLVVHEYPLVYSQVAPDLARQLEHEATLCQEFDPFTAAGATPVYDPLDAFYVPLAGFAAVSRPGPILRIYRLGTP